MGRCQPLREQSSLCSVSLVGRGASLLEDVHMKLQHLQGRGPWGGALSALVDGDLSFKWAKSEPPLRAPPSSRKPPPIIPSTVDPKSHSSLPAPQSALY